MLVDRTNLSAVSLTNAVKRKRFLVWKIELGLRVSHVWFAFAIAGAATECVSPYAVVACFTATML